MMATTNLDSKRFSSWPKLWPALPMTALVLALGATTLMAEEAPSAATAAHTMRREPARQKSNTGGRLTSDGSALARAALAAIEHDGSLVAPESLRLRVSSSGRTVALSGTAATIYDREQAARLAEGTTGVVNIHPSVVIKPTAAVEPSALEAAVKEAVRQANVIGPSFAVKAQANGTIQLNGEVTNIWTAVNAAKKVPGVTAIGGYAAQLPGHKPPTAEGELTVVAPSPEQDSVLAKSIQDALAKSPIQGLSIEVKEGVVALRGSLSGLYDSMMASRLVSRMSGVRGIKNELKLPGRVTRVGSAPDNQALEALVRRRIMTAGREGGRVGNGVTRIQDLTVHAYEGQVLLSGRASSESAAYAVVEAVASVTGVNEIVNALSYPTFEPGS